VWFNNPVVGVTCRFVADARGLFGMIVGRGLVVVYAVVRCLLGLVVEFGRGDRAKDVEIVVL
jgi:hypothetical protein